MSESEGYVYWEAQQSDLLCGMHCLNSLLQHPAFDEVALAQIGQDLDSKESALLGMNVMNNVNDSGFFSIQVLIEALGRLGDYTVTSIKSERFKNKSLSEQKAFVCHNDSHWICIRKVREKWFNLNSTNKGGPQMVSDFYLNVFLDSIAHNGYQIFVVEGEFTEIDPAIFSDLLADNQKFFPISEIEARYKEEVKNPNYKLNVNSSDTDAMDRAIAESLASYKRETEQSSKKEVLDMRFNPKEEEKKAFQGEGVAIHNSSQAKQFLKGEDEDSVQAYRMSLEDKFGKETEEELSGVLLRIRLPDGTSVERHFAKLAPISDVYQFAFWKQDKGNRDFSLSTSFPKKELKNSEETLLELGLEASENLVCSYAA